MQWLRLAECVALSVVVALVPFVRAGAQVTLDPEWPENPRAYRGEGFYRAASVRQTTDGGYIVAGQGLASGSFDRDVELIKLNAHGSLDPMWGSNPKTFGGQLEDSAHSVQQTTDGGYIVAGWTAASGLGRRDAYLIKLDHAGNFDAAWDTNPKTFGGDGHDYAHCVQQTTDGGYILAGTADSHGTEGNVCLTKLDSEGNLDLAWNPNPKTITGEQGSGAYAVQQTADGGYIVAGTIGGDAYLIKLDNVGNFDTAWDTNPRTFDVEGYDFAYSVQQTTDGGYIFAGAANTYSARGSKAYLIKLDSKGNLDSAWNPNPKSFSGERGSGAYAVQQTTDGGYIVAGWTESSRAKWEDIYLIKLDALGSIDSVWDPNPSTFGSSGWDRAFCVQQTTDGGYIVAGASGNGIDSYATVVKLAPARNFLRGDCDGNGSVAGVADALTLLEYLFRSGTKPPCLAACDANGDGTTRWVTDAIYILHHDLFGTEPPPKPYPDCGPGQLWTDGPLTCEVEPDCP